MRCPSLQISGTWRMMPWLSCGETLIAPIPAAASSNAGEVSRDPDEAPRARAGFSPVIGEAVLRGGRSPFGVGTVPKPSTTLRSAMAGGEQLVIVGQSLSGGRRHRIADGRTDVVAAARTWTVTAVGFGKDHVERHRCGAESQASFTTRARQFVAWPGPLADRLERRLVDVEMRTGAARSLAARAAGTRRTGFRGRGGLPGGSAIRMTALSAMNAMPSTSARK